MDNLWIPVENINKDYEGKTLIVKNSDTILGLCATTISYGEFFDNDTLETSYGFYEEFEVMDGLYVYYSVKNITHFMTVSALEAALLS